MALIGCGGRGSYLAGVFQSNPGVSLSWVCDVDTGRLKRGQKLAREKVKTSDDIRKVLADDTLDAVIVATPDHWHAPAAILACEAGKHVYVEKPMARTHSECAAMVAACKEAGVPLFVAYYRRMLPAFHKVKSLVEEGTIGEVRYAVIELCPVSYKHLTLQTKA